MLFNTWDADILNDWGVDVPSSWSHSENNINIDDFFQDKKEGEEKKNKIVKCPHCGEEIKL